MKDCLVGGAGETDNLADAAANLFAVTDDFFLFINSSLEELAYVGEGVVLLAEIEETGVGDSLRTGTIVQEAPL